MTDQHSILVVDDEPSICWALEKMLTGEGHAVVTASSAEEGLELARRYQPSMVILDVRLPQEDGITALPKFLEETNHAPVVIITAFGDLETAVAAVKHGATDYLTKPFKLEDAQRTCRQALQKSVRRRGSRPTRAMQPDTGSLVGVSSPMQLVFRQIALVADSDLSVLITGETGAGKELVAAAIHRHSRRADKAYIPLAPVTLNPDLIESELFGHVKGAFTGASEDRAGLFERAAGGTILLDEIGDLPLAVQVKLLRVLEQGQFTRVGDDQPRTADVRLLAATNSDLHSDVASGKFREDLFHRLSGVQIHLPPLRERPDDIAPLCEHFLKAMSYEEISVDDALLGELRSRPWRGNIRELKNAVGHAAVVARGRPITIDDFPEPKPGRGDDTASQDHLLEEVIRDWTETMMSDGSKVDSLHSKFLSAVEPSFLRIVLQSTGGNKAKAAEVLGIHRGTLRERLRAYGIEEN